MGYKHPDYLYEEITSSQLTDWIAYNNVEPFGHDMLYYMIGQAIAYFYNANRKKGTPAKKPWDFIPFIRFQGKQSQNTIKGLLTALVNETDPDKKEKKWFKKKRSGQTKRQKKRMRLLKENKLRGVN